MYLQYNWKGIEHGIEEPGRRETGGRENAVDDGRDCVGRDDLDTSKERLYDLWPHAVVDGRRHRLRRNLKPQKNPVGSLDKSLADRSESLRGERPRSRREPARASLITRQRRVGTSEREVTFFSMPSFGSG